MSRFYAQYMIQLMNLERMEFTPVGAFASHVYKERIYPHENSFDFEKVKKALDQIGLETNMDEYNELVEKYLKNQKSR